MNQAKEKTGPPINSDFYDILSMDLTDDERGVLGRWRTFLLEEVEPIANEQWEKGEFPLFLIPKIGELWYDTVGWREEENAPLLSHLCQMILSLEISRVDPSTRTFFGVHWGLAMNCIAQFGSPEQQTKWLPAMRRFEKIGSFALTEPLAGSDVARGLQTTAQRDGEHWILNGEKKWSGNALFADVNVVWARDTETNAVKGFLVEKGMTGYKVEPLKGKISLRTVNNVLIKLEDVIVSESNRLPKADSFRAVARHLSSGRTSVAWGAVGTAMGCYEKTLVYCQQREQFGKPITSFQLVQDKLARMLGNVTAMQAMVKQLTLREMREGVDPARSSLAKAWCSERLRETVALGRGLLGGNGILLEHDVARFFADAEAIYSYEGTYEMNQLIVGRAITGRSAFV